jgi:hypothetical protein
MNACQHCGQSIEWDPYWTTWDHAGRESKLTAELCQPERGFENSKAATP